MKKDKMMLGIGGITVFLLVGMVAGTVLTIVLKKAKENKEMKNLSEQVMMAEKIDELYKRLKEVNLEMRKCRDSMMASRGSEAERIYWMRGMSNAEQAQAFLSELEGLMSNYERKYGPMDI